MITEGIWKGQKVEVDHDEPCSIAGHGLDVMHHYDDYMRHYCPTGFLMCYECGGLAEEPEPFECTIMSEPLPQSGIGKALAKAGRVVKGMFWKVGGKDGKD